LLDANSRCQPETIDNLEELAIGDLPGVDQIDGFAGLVEGLGRAFSRNGDAFGQRSNGKCQVELLCFGIC
jgi:hypothetical protein